MTIQLFLMRNTCRVFYCEISTPDNSCIFCPSHQSNFGISRVINVWFIIKCKTNKWSTRYCAAGPLFFLISKSKWIYLLLTCQPGSQCIFLPTINTLFSWFSSRISAVRILWAAFLSALCSTDSWALSTRVRRTFLLRALRLDILYNNGPLLLLLYKVKIKNHT